VHQSSAPKTTTASSKREPIFNLNGFTVEEQIGDGSFLDPSQARDASRNVAGRPKGTAVRPIICSSVVAERPEGNFFPFAGAYDIFPDRPEPDECYIVDDDVIREKIDGLLSNVEIPKEEMVSLEKLLFKYESIFSNRIGSCSVLEHVIDTGDAKPIACRPRPMTPAKREIINTLLDELIDNDIVEPSVSPWASCPVLTPKKDGGYRLVVDFRPINLITVADSYPLTRIDDSFSYLGNAVIMSKFDLSHGFYQIATAQKDRIKTAFHTPPGISTICYE
jgi:hypothetical protein